MPDHILFAIYILLALAVIGALMIWRLWAGVKKLYNSNNHQVPTRLKWINAGLLFCVVSPPILTSMMLASLY